MAWQHGKDTVVKVATKDISQYTDSSELTIGGDVHDVTTYGNNSHRKGGGLGEHSFKCSGTYDTTAVTGPRAVLKPLRGTTVAVIRQPEGTGTGKPQDAFNAVVGEYVETSPVADYVKWSCTFEVDGDVTSTTQA